MKPVLVASLVVFGLLLPVVTVVHDTSWMITSHQDHADTVNASLVQDTQRAVADGSAIPAVYSEREQRHLQDVRSLVVITETLLVLAGLGGLAALFKQGLFEHASYWMTGIIAVVAVAGVAAFDATFTVFHELFFTGDSYLFDPASTLIQTFPASFFADGFYHILVAWMMMLLSYAAITVIQRR